MIYTYINTCMYIYVYMYIYTSPRLCVSRDAPTAESEKQRRVFLRHWVNPTNIYSYTRIYSHMHAGCICLSIYSHSLYILYIYNI